MDSSSSTDMLSEQVKKLTLEEPTTKHLPQDTTAATDTVNSTDSIKSEDTLPSHRYNTRSRSKYLHGTAGTPPTPTGSTYIPPHRRSKKATHIRFNDEPTSKANIAPDSNVQGYPTTNTAASRKNRSRTQKQIEQNAEDRDFALHYKQQTVAALRYPQTQTSPRLHMMERPEPVQAYLYFASQSPQILDSPRRLLVILDLNGTLLFRKARGSNAFVARPNLGTFLDYLFSNHNVMVWSSAQPRNVKQMCNELFTAEQRAQLVAVWARDKLKLTPSAYKSKVQVYKQLSWVWEDPTIQGNIRVGQANTVLIDDSVEKAASEPFNLVKLDEFEGKPEQMKSDVLAQVIQYLEVLSQQRDVSSYIHSEPFQYVLEASTAQ